jgi:hypothetical protein
MRTDRRNHACWVHMGNMGVGLFLGCPFLNDGLIPHRFKSPAVVDFQLQVSSK